MQDHDKASRTPRPLVATETGYVFFSWRKALWFWSMFLGGLYAIAFALTAQLALLSALLVFLTICLGHSLGLHRGEIHQSFKSAGWFRVLLLYFDALSGLGGPLSWVRLHATRDYWQNRSDCPPYFAYRHSLARDFVWNLHYSFAPADERANVLLPPALLADPWLLFFECTWLIHLATLALLLWFVLGWDAVVTCVCLRASVAMLGHWFVGYAAHRWGHQPFAIAGAFESGTNHWLLGVLSFGEGFHNNHHAYPGSARMGFAPHQLDLSYATLRLLGVVGLVKEIRAWPDAGTAVQARSSRAGIAPT